MSAKPEAIARLRAKIDAAPEIGPIDESPPEGRREDRSPAWVVPPAATIAEWQTAPLAPRCIVEGYLFADVATMIAPGGTGKTTATLHEAACIVLGLPVWGLRVVEPGPVLLITAEDRRPYLVARLREICRAMRLTDAQTALVREFVRIDDRTADVRRLTAVVCDVVAVAGFAHEIVHGCWMEGFAPALVQLDPMVSFGTGESRVNDAEQGLIDAARVITGGLDCCTRFVHHSGKLNARDKAADQYAGRGGSALPDGCRMVSVLTSATAAELTKATGATLADDEGAFVLHRPKVSYAPPNRPPIYVKRVGFAFTLAESLTAEGREDAEAETRRAREVELRGALLDAAEAAQRAGLPLSQRALAENVRGFKTNDKRDALALLLAEGWLIEGRVPPGWRPVNNSRRTWLVRLDAAERDVLRSSGELPVAALMPPPSIATPPEGDSK